jgi:hypothetical protein
MGDSWTVLLQGIVISSDGALETSARLWKLDENEMLHDVGFHDDSI